MIENTIKNNLDKILNVALPEGHQFRFEAKLNAAMQENKRRNNNVRRLIIWTVATAACLTLAFILNIKDNNNDDEENFIEVHNYYSMLLEEETEATIQALDDLNETDKTEVRQDIETLLGEHIPFSENGEQNTSLMIAAYSSKIQALQQIKDNIKKNN